MNPPNNHDQDEDDAAAGAAPANIVRMRWRPAAHNNDDDAVAAANNDNFDDDEAEDSDDTDEDEDEDDDDADEDDDVFDPVEGEQICQEAMTLLQNRLNLPSRLRDRTMVRFAQQFINNVKEDIHKMVTDIRMVGEGYDGLDSERDTEEKVETAIRCGPEVLSREEAVYGLCPIQCLTMMKGDHGQLLINVKAVAFVPLFARLAIEFHSFDETERGGLLIADGNGVHALEGLACNSEISDDEDFHHQERVDTTCLAVLIRLRQAQLFTKVDIQQYQLIHTLWNKGFANQRFRFMTGWDPSSLLQTNTNNELPFHHGTHNVRKFRVVLDAYIRYYPKWKGLHALFSINNDGWTPFTLACGKLTHTKVMEVVEDSLVRYTTNESVDSNAALILAASDDTISLDGVYFIIRRQPDKMLSMLRNTRREDEKSRTLVSSLSSSSSNNHTTINNSTNPIANRKNNSQHNTDSIANANHSTEDGHKNKNQSNHSNGLLRRSTRKRKRN